VNDQRDPGSRAGHSGVVWVPGRAAGSVIPVTPKIQDNAERNRARIIVGLTVVSSVLALYDLFRMALGF
jgi:hypothetical protein